MNPYSFSPDPDALFGVPALAIAYAVAIRLYPTRRRRTACFGVALALLLAAFVSPLGQLARHYLLSAHLLQNVVVAEWAPALAVLGIPPRLADRLPHRVSPAVALLAWLATYYVWHVPWLYDAALRHPNTLLHLEHAFYFAAGVLFWWPVLQGREGSGQKAVYLFAAFVLVSPLGLLLALLPSPIYTFYEHAPRLWGLSALTDQQIAGVTMAAEQAIVFCFACALYFARFLREEDARELFKFPKALACDADRRGRAGVTARPPHPETTRRSGHGR